MKEKVKQLLKDKNLSMPILSFPATQLIGCNVKDLLHSSENQAKGMQAIMERCNLSASLNMMDLSVEAECFGAEIKYEDNEIPTVTKGAINSLDEISNLLQPKVGDGRTSIYIEGVRIAKYNMPTKKIMCGVIGPFSLACRIFDMTELMMSCFEDENMVHQLLEKCSTFLIEYINAYKLAGADGVIMAEPASGLLSPILCEEFSSRYVNKIFNEVGEDNFILVYHNCGNVLPLIETISNIRADIYHFGNAIDMYQLLQNFPSDKIVMGNINPVFFKTENKEYIYNQTFALLEKCTEFSNFHISSGCDIPSDSSWENIDAYFNAIIDFFKERV